MSAVDLFWQPFCGEFLWNALGRTCVVSGVRAQCSPSPLTDINITEGLAGIEPAVALPAKIYLLFHSVCLYRSVAHRLAVARQAGCSVRTVFHQIPMAVFY